MQVATGIAEVPSNLILGQLVKLNSSLPLCVRILSLKVSHTFGTRVMTSESAYFSVGFVVLFGM